MQLACKREKEGPCRFPMLFNSLNEHRGRERRDWRQRRFSFNHSSLHLLSLISTLFTTFVQTPTLPRRKLLNSIIFSPSCLTRHRLDLSSGHKLRTTLPFVTGAIGSFSRGLITRVSVVGIAQTHGSSRGFKGP
jgi:hypothetical protein